MISFETVRELRIPEGVVEQIKNTAGNILWRFGYAEIIEDIAVVNMQDNTETTGTGGIACAEER